MSACKNPSRFKCLRRWSDILKTEIVEIMCTLLRVKTRSFSTFLQFCFCLPFPLSYFKYLASLRTLDFSIPTPKVLASCITKVVKEIEQIKSGKFDVQKKKIKLVNTANIVIVTLCSLYSQETKVIKAKFIKNKTEKIFSLRYFPNMTILNDWNCPKGRAMIG